MLGNSPLANDDLLDDDKKEEQFEEEASVDGGLMRDIGVEKMTEMDDVEEGKNKIDARNKTLGDDLLGL